MARPKRRFRLNRRRIDLKRTLFLLPNLITQSSIFCGFYSMVLSSRAQDEGDFYRAALLIVFAMFFDGLDGRVARMTKTESAFGLQIDSLADVVSFGAAPALLVYHWTLHQLGLLGMVASFAFTATGAIRLARFNVLTMDKAGAPTKPGAYIIGLPIPAAAGVLTALLLANHAADGALQAPAYTVPILALVIGLGVLMVSGVPFRSFKNAKLGARSVTVVAFAAASSIAVGLELGPAFVLLWLLGCYVSMGICEYLWQIPHRLRRALRPSLSDSESSPTGEGSQE